MNDQEIQREVEKDLTEILTYIDSREANYRREVIKANRFPLYFTPNLKKTKSGNTWFVLFEAKSKKDKKDSQCCFVCYFQSVHGYYAVMPTSTNGRFHYIFYQPHFFGRYAQRMGLDIHGVDLMVHYFRMNHTYAYDTKNSGTIQEIYGSSFHGVALGVVLLSGSFFFRTFISYEMLKGEQIQKFTENEKIRREIHNE